MAQQVDNSLLSYEDLPVSDPENDLDTQPLTPDNTHTSDISVGLTFPAGHESYLDDEELMTRRCILNLGRKRVDQVLPKSFADAIGDLGEQILIGFTWQWNYNTKHFTMPEKYAGDWNTAFSFSVRVFRDWDPWWEILTERARELDISTVSCCVCMKELYNYQEPDTWQKWLAPPGLPSAYSLGFFLCDRSTIGSHHALCQECFDNLMTEPKKHETPGNFDCPLCHTRPLNWLWFASMTVPFRPKLITWVRMFYQRLLTKIKSEQLEVVGQAYWALRSEFEDRLTVESNAKDEALKQGEIFRRQVIELSKVNDLLRREIRHRQLRCMKGNCINKRPAILQGAPQPKKKTVTLPGEDNEQLDGYSSSDDLI